MRRTWNIALAFVLLGVVTIGFGLWTKYLARERERQVAELETAGLELDRYEREGTLEDRAKAAAERRDWLAARLEASTRGAASLDRRFGELFSELDLVVRSTTPWTATEDSVAVGAQEFDRTVECSGPFASLLNAVASLEAWPDLLRVRKLTMVPESAGRVTATLRISVLRLPPDATAGDADAAAGDARAASGESEGG